jgi:hypothetical protein
MIILIPIAIMLATVNCYLAFFKESVQAVRRSVLSATVGIFLFIAATTELLGLIDAINRLSVIVIWSLLDVILLIWYLRLIRKTPVHFSELFNTVYNRGKLYARQLGPLSQVVILTLLGITLVVALVATPNNNDSLCYHLSRIGYWVQNGNVQHYASHIERSISFAPLSEYVHLHTFLLSDSNRYFQLLQWLSLIGIMGFVSMLVELMSGSKYALRVALCFVCTIPIVVLESMTTQNDLVVTFFIVATVFYVMDFLRYNNTLTIVLMIMTVALGMMTKGTFVFYTLPFALYMAQYLVRRKEWKLLLGILVGVVILTTAINMPFWLRTYEIFGTPVGNISAGNRNQITGYKVFISSIAKHVFLHLGFVSPGNVYNDFLLGKLAGLHNLLDVHLDSTATGMNFKMNKLNFNEDFAHNFLAMWLILIGLILVPFTRLSLLVKSYWALALFSFLVFCYFISYQTYGSRLHIPFFILMAPGLGVLASLASAAIQRILIAVLWLNALPFGLLSVTHPLLSTSWFFEKVFPVINEPLKLNIQTEKLSNLKQKSILESSAEETLWGDSWVEVENLVTYVDSVGAKNIGFYFEEYSYDYAYQYVLKKNDRNFEHILVRNPSRVLEKTGFVPDCIISELDRGEQLEYNSRQYIKTWRGVDRCVYLPLSDL